MGLPYIRTADGTKVQLSHATRERPLVRQAIERLCRERGLSLGQLWALIQSRRLSVSDGIRKQCRKMVAEQLAR
jgi:hypothetical protein